MSAKLTNRVAQRFVQAAGYVIGPRGLEKPKGAGITLQKGAAYYLGASSSPKFVVLTSVTDDMVKYKDYPFNGKEYSMQRWIAVDLLYQGTTTALKTMGGHMDPGLKRSMASLMKGGKGRVEKLDDYKPVTITVEAAPNLRGKDLWREAEEYGSVGGVHKDDEMVYEISTSQKMVEKIKNDRRFQVIEVKDR